MDLDPTVPASAAEPPEPLPWLYRSEAFAEDLLGLVAPLPQWREGAPQRRAHGVRDGWKGTPGEGQHRAGGGGTGAGRFAGIEGPGGFGGPGLLGPLGPLGPLGDLGHLGHLGPLGHLARLGRQGT